MNINLHNKIEIKYGKEEYVFYNTMLKSLKSEIINLNSYFNYIALGIGEGNIDASTFKLKNHIKSYALENDVIQSNLERGTLFVKKYAIIDDTSLNGIAITEAGISSNANTDPIIYNYFSLRNESCPNGIVKEENQEIVISVTIYLDIISESEALLTLGNNKFIELLLGLGIKEKKLYACRGKNLSKNKAVYREKIVDENKFPCDLIVEESDSSLILNFCGKMKTGETNEIVLLIDNSPFLRLNTQEHYLPVSSTNTYSSQINRIVDLGENIKSVKKVVRAETNEEENHYVLSNYANDFGDKISLPFNKLFDNQTPRFISKEGDKIFFVSDDKVFGYRNENYSINQIKIENLSIKNITKIISFNNKIFVISKSAPYISLFIFDGEIFKRATINYNCNLFEKIYDIEITEGRNNIIMFGIIEEETKHAHTLYFSINETLNTIEFNGELTNTREYNNVLAIYKNNFTDSVVIFIKIGENSALTRNIYFFPDQTIDDIYSTIGYQITQNARELYVKSRAIVVEKTTNPSIWIFFYPEWFKYTLSIFGEEQNNYISTNLKYLIQKYDKSTYKIFSLVGYNNLTEFKNGLPKNINLSKILDFEFLNDTLLIFLNDAEEPIVAYNLYETSAMLENVDKSENDYVIETQSYNLLGKNNEGIAVKFTVRINIWFSLKKFIKLFLEKT